MKPVFKRPFDVLVVAMPLLCTSSAPARAQPASPQRAPASNPGSDFFDAIQHLAGIPNPKVPGSHDMNGQVPGQPPGNVAAGLAAGLAFDAIFGNVFNIDPAGRGCSDDPVSLPNGRVFIQRRCNRNDGNDPGF